MKTLLAAACTCAALLLLACNASDERLPLLYGDWQGVEWTDGNNLGKDKAAQVTFSFREDGTYTAKLGPQEETGGFVFRDAKLYTTAVGDTKVEKVVGVADIDEERLVFDMNRSGVPEKLVLERVR